MSPLRTEILATLLKILLELPPPHPPNQNPGYASGMEYVFIVQYVKVQYEYTRSRLIV